MEINLKRTYLEGEDENVVYGFLYGVGEEKDPAQIEKIVSKWSPRRLSGAIELAFNTSTFLNPLVNAYLKKGDMSEWNLTWEIIASMIVHQKLSVPQSDLPPLTEHLLALGKLSSGDINHFLGEYYLSTNEINNGLKGTFTLRHLFAGDRMNYNQKATVLEYMLPEDVEDIVADGDGAERILDVVLRIYENRASVYDTTPSHNQDWAVPLRKAVLSAQEKVALTAEQYERLSTVLLNQHGWNQGLVALLLADARTREIDVSRLYQSWLSQKNKMEGKYGCVRKLPGETAARPVERRSGGAGTIERTLSQANLSCQPPPLLLNILPITAQAELGTGQP